MSFRISNINSTYTLERSIYDLKNNLISTKVLTEADGINYNVSNNTFYTSNFAANFDWSALGSGLVPVGMPPPCNSIAIDSKGNVYIGGEFTTAGGLSVSNIVRWDGSNWYPLGSGLDGTCYSLAIDSNDNVYAGGDFTNIAGAGGLIVNNIAKWSPSTGEWYALGASPSGLDSPCFSLAIDSNDNVYAGGNFTDAGGVTVSNIAKWSPSTSTWSDVGTGLDGECNSLAIDSNDNVYAGGTFIDAGGVTVSNIAEWDGSNWSALGAGLDNSCRTIAIDSNDNVYAGGDFTNIAGAGGLIVNRVAKWSPSTGVWSALGTGLNDSCYSVAIDSNDNVYAGGLFITSGGITVNRISKWTPSTGVWSALGAGLDSLCKSLAIDSNDNLYAGGAFANIEGGGITVNYIAYYSNQTYINLVYNSRKLKTIRGPADSTLVFVNSDTNKAFNIDIS
jgi:hypothetical protein